MAQVVFVARPGALDEGDVLRFLAVRGAQQFAAGGAVRIGEALEFQAGDDVIETVITVRLYLRRIVGFPASRPDHRADFQLDRLGRHIEVDGIVFARGFGLLAVRRADDGRVEHVALRIGHRVRQIGGARFGKTVFVRIANLRLHRFGAFAAGGAVLVDVTRRYFEGDGVIAALPAHRNHFGLGQHAHVAVGLEPAQVDFQPAGRVAHLGEIAVHQCGAPAQAGIALGEDHLLAAFGGFQRRRHAADTAADDENSLVCCDRNAHSSLQFRLLQGAYLKTHPFQIAEYPGRDGIHAGGIDTRNRAGIDQPALPAVDIGLSSDVSGMAVAVADQIVIAGTGEGPTVMRHVGDENLAPAEFQHRFLPVVSKQPAGFRHHAVQRRDIADIVAIHNMDRNTEPKGSSQGIDTDQVTAVDDGLRPIGLRRHDRGHERRGAVMAVRNNADFHIEMLYSMSIQCWLLRSACNAHIRHNW